MQEVEPALEKCQFTHVVVKLPKPFSTKNRKWWSSRLNLSMGVSAGNNSGSISTFAGSQYSSMFEETLPKASK